MTTCPRCNEIILIGLCEACGYVDVLLVAHDGRADPRQLLVDAAERQFSAEDDATWTAAVNETHRTFVACGRWCVEAPGES